MMLSFRRSWESILVFETRKIEYIWIMYLEALIKGRYTEFANLCKSHRVDKLYFFGSSITEHFDPKSSDIDVVVHLNIEDPLDYGETLLSLWDKLELFFERKVDLLTEESLKNPYLKKSIEASKKLIYDGQREKILI